MAVINLRDVNRDNWRACAALTLAPAQQDWVAPNMASLAEAGFEPHYRPRAIYADDVLVGFLMYCPDIESDDAKRFWLFRFMVDARYQQRGYGRQALALAIAEMRALGAATIRIPFKPDNLAAASLYAAAGFVPTGERDEAGDVLADLSWPESEGVPHQEPAAGNLQNHLQFLLELEKLKAILRKTRPIGLERYENSAEHSWHVSLMAILLAEHAEPQVDIARVVKMLLLHDIVEIDADDTFLYDEVAAQAKAGKEVQAAQRLFGMLPPAQAADFMAAWQEYETRATPEGRFAYACDRMLPVLQNLETQGRTWREHQVRLEQVLNKNQVINDAAPRLWQYLRARLQTAKMEGWLD
ncbi:GNAT family N-acetyltransferase [Parachitinimonas caeni]|uniref:5'-deoxynucleotidase n=1 Tax=Parachitinimonas caeni TaxID=3031301 RepID=A0ABT7DT95_9NEIS|nr:GNAT family N-acetyltransferase [Parachitinimonas caeni]MDK2123283.1 GNAT family N-acetyltransferase [Parachitinimonas caeni]